MKRNTPTNTRWPLQEGAPQGHHGGPMVGTFMLNDCYVAGKAAFADGLGVRDCPHRGPNGQAWLRGWHVARLMGRLAKHLDAHQQEVH